MTEERVSRLRTEFDAVFSRPVQEAAPRGVEVLLVRAGDARVALRLDELLWVEVAVRLARVPGARADLSGIGVARGRMVAAFDLAALLSRDRTDATHLAVLRAEPTVALAFSAIEGRCALPMGSAPADASEIVTTVPVGGRPLGVVSVAGVLRLIRKGEVS